MLDTARYDGSFYTSTAAAALLASLALRDTDGDWSDPNFVASFRICDPACGTGTLLMAVAERIRDLRIASGRSDTEDEEALGLLLVEDVLWGYDVNLTATHMAASTLGMLSPTTQFSRMNIHRALLGVFDGQPYLGSLDFLHSQARLAAWPSVTQQVESEVGDVLSRAGYAPVVTGDPEETLRLVEVEKPDLVILDLMLPGTDGIELMKDILEMADVPIIFLSAYGRDELIARAFDMGAVDYVVKPFSPTELAARIRAALRRREVSEPSEPYVLGDLTIDYAERRVTPCRPSGRADGNRVPDARRAFDQRRASVGPTSTCCNGSGARGAAATCGPCAPS